MRYHFDPVTTKQPHEFSTQRQFHNWINVANDPEDPFFRKMFSELFLEVRQKKETKTH